MEHAQENGADDVWQLALEAGSTGALDRLALRFEKAGDKEAAENIVYQVPSAGGSSVVLEMIREREQRGERSEAERLARYAAAHGNTEGFGEIAKIRSGGMYPSYRILPYGVQSYWVSFDTATDLWRQALAAGTFGAVRMLAAAITEKGGLDKGENVIRYGVNEFGEPEDRPFRIAANSK